MFGKEFNAERTALRAAIQMGGARLFVLAWRERLTSDGGILTARVRRGQMRCFNASKRSPAQRMAEPRRRLMAKGLYDGYHGKDGR